MQRICTRVGVEVVAFDHETVLLAQTVDALLPCAGGKYIDCTLGGAGHTERLLQRSEPSGQVLALDQDEIAIEHAKLRLQSNVHRVRFVHANFRKIESVAKTEQFMSADGILFDLGVSSPQFDDAKRGFSYRQPAHLDMRMDRTSGQTAADIVNFASEETLIKIFFEYGEEKFARRIARAIVRARAHSPLLDTVAFAELVKEAIPAAARRSGPHPARRVFQALRIAVNDELGALSEALQGAFRTLRVGGRLAIITFHSLEDRMVKQAFRDFAQGCICPPSFPICQCHRVPRAKLITRHPVVPNEDEVAANTRARSAKLRVLEKLTQDEYGDQNKP